MYNIIPYNNPAEREAAAETGCALIIRMLAYWAGRAGQARQKSPGHGQCLVTAKTKLKIRTRADEPGQSRTSPEARVKLMQSCDLVLVVARRGAPVLLGPWGWTGRNTGSCSLFFQGVW